MIGASGLAGQSSKLVGVGMPHALRNCFFDILPLERPVPNGCFSFRHCPRRGSSQNCGQVAIGTFPVGLWGKPVAQRIFISFQSLWFSISGSLVNIFDKNVFFEQNLYKVFGFQWTKRNVCCIIISFLCRRANAVIYRKR